MSSASSSSARAPRRRSAMQRHLGPALQRKRLVRWPPPMSRCSSTPRRQVGVRVVAQIAGQQLRLAADRDREGMAARGADSFGLGRESVRERDHVRRRAARRREGAAVMHSWPSKTLTASRRQRLGVAQVGPHASRSSPRACAAAACAHEATVTSAGRRRPAARGDAPRRPCRADRRVGGAQRRRAAVGQRLRKPPFDAGRLDPREDLSAPGVAPLDLASARLACRSCASAPGDCGRGAVGSGPPARPSRRAPRP